MEAVATPADAGRALLERLLARHSPWPLAAPEPTPAQLDLVFDLALRAPDHGSLRPWRFAVVRGPAREALGEVFVQAARARDPQGDAERFRSKAMAAPLIIAMAARVRMGHKVPEAEQVMAVAAAAMNMLNALHLLGYGGFWATGANVRDDVVRRALGFGGSDRMVGFLYVGTPPPGSRPPQRPSREAHVREWVGPSAGRVERGLGVGGDLDNVRPR
ncbi:nitroreductase family protein [Sphaerotilus sp.]|uniref:nitroreductase family protein n=1 Tax=Sphaerotilus sp. TaxID=2093942 RepID=UPI002ACE7CDD|nr:nitroreductase family protein [Sphaerotilus sp.]MDZ7855867.1 nitroreductase family protein [Sphaerotilus sp.]